jgi:Ca2+-binding RTX toxin-like protein
MVRVLLPLVITCSLLAAAGTAEAATITYSHGVDGAVVYAAESGEALDLDVGFQAGCGVDGSGNPLDCVTFYGNAVSWTPAANCQAQTGGDVWCLLDGDHSGVKVTGGDGTDGISIFESDLDGFPADSGYPVTVEGGGGDDRLDGGSGPEQIYGGPGADLIGGRGGDDRIYGEEGNDVIYGDGMTNGNDGSAGGDDQIHGGDGNDTITGDLPQGGVPVGKDVLDGGPGRDTIKDDWYRFDGSGGDEDPPPTVTFDGKANDGRPGEQDNVIGIERIESGVPHGAEATTYIGDDGPNDFLLLFTNGIVKGNGGADDIEGSDYADRLDGGSGPDHLYGGFGDDEITGGPGRDTILGDRDPACEFGPIFGSCTTGTGNDVIHARDGAADSIDCGPGADTAFVDRSDTTSRCERIKIGGRTGGLPPAKVNLPRQTLRQIAARRSLLVRCRLPRSGICSVKAAVPLRVARHLGLVKRQRGKTFALGSASHRYRRAGSATLKIRLRPRVARSLRRVRSLPVRILTTARYGSGSRRSAGKFTVGR